MENLSAIVNSLSPGEENLVRHFYKYKNFGEYRKRALLFELLSKKSTNLTESQAIKQLGYSSKSSFANVKIRLRSDVLSILLMQESSTKFGTPYAQALFDCRRGLMQGEILINRGVYQEALDVLQKASRIAQKFEFFTELMQIEDLIRNYAMSNGCADDFIALSASIRENYAACGTFLEAKQKHYEISMPGLLGVKSFEEYSLKGSEMIRASSTSSSSRTNFYNGLAALNYYSSIRDFEMALKYAGPLLKSAETDPVVKSKSNQAGIHMDLANIYLNRCEYDLAIRHSSRSVNLFKAGMVNQLQAYVILFFSYFRNGDFAKASETLDAANDHRIIKSQQVPLMNSRLHFLRAGLTFSKGDYDETANLLRDSTELMKDKEGWMPGLFLLESLVLIEKNDIELAIYKIDAFRKMLYRWGMDNDEHRIGIITRLLRQIVRDNCDYAKIFKRQNNEIRLLTGESSKCYWDPAGYEIIRFDEWLLKKVS